VQSFQPGLDHPRSRLKLLSGNAANLLEVRFGLPETGIELRIVKVTIAGRFICHFILLE
jgi:hypothetical protein